MTRLEFLRRKQAGMQRRAFSEESAEFVRYVLLDGKKMSESDCQRELEKLGYELSESSTRRSGPLQVGEAVKVNKFVNTNSMNVEVCDTWNGKRGTIEDVKSDHLIVQLGSYKVRFEGNKAGKETGLGRDISDDDRGTWKGKAVEVVYLTDKLSTSPGAGRIKVVQDYIDKGLLKGEDRSSVYYSGMVTTMAYNKSGQLYFSISAQQRGNEFRTFSPAKGTVLYLGQLNKRPSGWKAQYAKMQMAYDQEVLEGGGSEGPDPFAITASRRVRGSSSDRQAMIRLAHTYPEMRKHLVPMIRKLAMVEEVIQADEDEIMAGRTHGQKGKWYGTNGPDVRGPGEWEPEPKDICYYETGDEKDRCYVTVNGGPGGPGDVKPETNAKGPGKAHWKEYETQRWPEGRPSKKDK